MGELLPKPRRKVDEGQRQSKRTHAQARGSNGKTREARITMSLNLSPEQRAELLKLLRIEPCHTTGMHDPTHTTKHVCAGQLRASLERLLGALGVTPGELPHALHDDCYWCHGVPTQEEYRVERRALHEWAGVEIPKALSEPAPDARAYYKRRAKAETDA
jgi:hypothetical protein